MKMIKLILLSVLAIVCVDFANAQDNYSGKYLVATLMKEKASPCNKVEYCVLKFSKDSVEVSYPVKSYCNTPEQVKNPATYNKKLTRKYKWEIVNDKLSIPELKDFNPLMFEEKSEDFINSLYARSE